MRGKAALDFIFKSVADQRQKGEQVPLSHLRPLQTFSWALQESQRASVVKWVKQEVASKHSTTPAAEAAAKRASKKKTCPAKQTTDALVGNLFKNF